MDDTNWKNRKERAKALIAAGWTDFDSYIRKREEAAGNPNCGGKMDILLDFFITTGMPVVTGGLPSREVVGSW